MIRWIPLLAALASAAPETPAPKPPELTAHQRQALKNQGIPDTNPLNDDTLRRLAENLPREPGGRASPAAASWLKLSLPSLKRALDRRERWSEDPEGFRALPDAERARELKAFGEYFKPGAFSALGTPPPPAAAAKPAPDERPLRVETSLKSKPVPPAAPPPQASDEEKRKNTEWALDELWKAWQKPPPKR